MRYCFLILLTGCSLFFNTKAPESAKGNEYKIKFSSTDWIQKKDNRSDYVYENNQDGRVILSNSFCQEFQDEALDNLATKTFRTIGEFKSKKGEYTTFHNREAYRLEGEGSVDGVKVGLKLLNTRRNNCYFDFVSISPLKTSTQSSADFDAFLNTVEFK